MVNSCSMKCLIWLVLVVLQTGCASLFEKPLAFDQQLDRRHLQQDRAWHFEGRLALSDAHESIQAAINWNHQLEKDVIELTGPLGQGRLAITVLAGLVVIEDGETRQEYQGDVDAVLSQQVAVAVPVRALKYWVLGVSDPGLVVANQENGFVQAGWAVQYKEMQWVKSLQLPKKMLAEKEVTKIKLIVDQWDI